MKKTIVLGFAVAALLFGSTQIAHASYFSSYFEKVLPNLEDVYQQNFELAENVQTRIENFTGDPSKATLANDLLTQAFSQLATAKESMGEAMAAYSNESEPTPPPFALMVTNENGVILATSEMGYNMCVVFHGVTTPSEPNRCWIGNVVFINPSMQENAAMLAFANRENYTPFPLTTQHVDHTKTELKQARKSLSQAIAALGPKTSSGGSKSPSVNPEIQAVSTEVLAPLD